VDFSSKFTVDPGVFSVSLNINLPIKIGTIPLSCNFSRFQNNSNGTQLPLSFVEKYENLRKRMILKLFSKFHELFQKI